jgi:hypothetical protein
VVCAVAAKGQQEASEKHHRKARELGRVKCKPLVTSGALWKELNGHTGIARFGFSVFQCLSDHRSGSYFSVAIADRILSALTDASNAKGSQVNN